MLLVFPTFPKVYGEPQIYSMPMMCLFLMREKNILEGFVSEAFAPVEKEILEGWQDSALRVYEVTRIERDRGIHIRDLFDNNEIFVNDIRSSRRMTKWDIGALRVIKTPGKFYLSGAACLLPVTRKADMIQFGKESFLGFMSTDLQQ